MAAGGRATTRASPSPIARRCRRRTSKSGRCTTRSAARRSCCAAKAPIFFRAPPPPRWRGAVRRPRWSRLPASATRRRCSAPSRSVSCATSCCKETAHEMARRGPAPRLHERRSPIDLRCCAQERLRAMRRQYRARRLLTAGLEGRMARHRRRSLPRRRRRRVRRCRQSALRASRAQRPDDHVILPELISKEPLGPAVRHGDDRWFDIVKWSLFAMIEAEELGLSSKNIDQQAKSPNPAIQRFVGASGDLGKMLALDNRWAYQIVRQVGNYAESFDANLKPLGFERGYNRLWTQGGLLYVPPIR